MNKQDLQELSDETYGLLLSFRPSARMQSRNFGDYGSIHSGEGFDFEDVDEFQPGDNLRRVNVGATSRENKLMITKRSELKEARVLILFNMSESMYLRNKMKIAFSAASVVMRSALAFHMPLGLWIVGAGTDIELRPKIGEEHFNHINDVVAGAICGDIDTAQADASPLEFSSYSLRHFLSQGSFLFIISDFLGLKDEDFVQAILSETESCDAIPIIVQDELEYSYPVSVFGKYGQTVYFYDVKRRGVSEGQWMNAQTAREKRDVQERRFDELCSGFHKRGLSYAHLDSPDVGKIFGKLQEALG